mgnify:CR=1 FL=1
MEKTSKVAAVDPTVPRVFEDPIGDIQNPILLPFPNDAETVNTNGFFQNTWDSNKLGEKNPPYPDIYEIPKENNKVFYLQRQDIKYTDYIVFAVPHTEGTETQYSWYVNDSLEYQEWIEDDKIVTDKTKDPVIVSEYKIIRPYNRPVSNNGTLRVQCKRKVRKVVVASNGVVTSEDTEDETDLFVMSFTNQVTPVSYTHLTLPTRCHRCRSRWSRSH